MLSGANLHGVRNNGLTDPPLVPLNCRSECRHLHVTFKKLKIRENEGEINEIWFLRGPPKGISPGLSPTAMEGGDWTWSRCKVFCFSSRRRLSMAQWSAFMLSSLPSTATTTHRRFAVAAPLPVDGAEVISVGEREEISITQLESQVKSYRCSQMACGFLLSNAKSRHQILLV